ncbi:hypothetical protein BDK51DRAFT_26081 [Blyttiomyces helicus]|uniref:DUF4246 domain-containing protein n=1 Tax=Blyttiomyces helicus TaxID=388810 RepID=A0A4V1IQX5_9FUNG|nr:hypothetical protein BDK51DRAFT_26081 [Blyttiomyces helicus]|eukprot:RKO88077.1 hypothetical protein BDK51DRAFT_26081 [Blyttiomyces helicus]
MSSILTQPFGPPQCFAKGSSADLLLVEKEHIPPMSLGQVFLLLNGISYSFLRDCVCEGGEIYFHTHDTFFWTDDPYIAVPPDALALLKHRYDRLENGDPGPAALTVRAVDRDVPSSVTDLLAWHLDAIASRDDRDFHPGSEGKVQDLIHPSLHSLALGFTSLVSGKRWLPAELHVEAGGRSQFTEYISGLYPRTHAELYWCIERVFDVVLPMLEETVGRQLKERNSQVRGPL